MPLILFHTDLINSSHLGLVVVVAYSLLLVGHCLLKSRQLPSLVFRQQSYSSSDSSASSSRLPAFNISNISLPNHSLKHALLYTSAIKLNGNAHSSKSIHFTNKNASQMGPEMRTILLPRGNLLPSRLCLQHHQLGRLG